MQVNGTEVVHFDMWKVEGHGLSEYLIIQETEGGHGKGPFRLNRLDININRPGIVTLTYVNDYLSLNDAVQTAVHYHQQDQAK